jgi:hypothetical protein
MYSKKYLSSERDIHILIFIWMWKVTTTSAVYQRFFRNHTLTAAYYRLLMLERGGFISSQKTAEYGYNYWTLERKGFDLVRGHVPELQSDAYRSQAPYHDLMVSAVQLGDWIAQWPPHAKVYTEQQLRQYHPDFLPRWFSEFGRHADGFFRIEEKGAVPRTIAVEVELSQQSRTHYHDLAHRYGSATWIDRVFWIASTEIHAKSLDRYFTEVSQYREQKMHNILPLNEFLSSGWRARFQFGSEIGKTISEVLSDQSGINSVSNGYQDGIASAWKSLIDRRKRPMVPCR